MDSSPHDLRRPDRIRRSVGRHTSCTCKKRVGHSPTRRKCWEKRRLNRGGRNCELIALPFPLSYQGPVIPVGPPFAVFSYHVVPHTSAHMDPRGRVASCHVAAPCVPPAPRVGHPRLCHVALALRGIRAMVPRATSAPRHVRCTRHISTRGSVDQYTPFFAILIRKN